ncbi:unnamed protein product [Paramecium sonneborni]|uniref:Uncharacterized protein n=1 Tax=Paramecium sonneborni TaxID=65129 RepID=A0A8S1QRX7_9CILI|nr:unnamed protein product [Paramecium sonneborni]
MGNMLFIPCLDQTRKNRLKSEDQLQQEENYGDVYEDEYNISTGFMKSKFQIKKFVNNQVQYLSENGIKMKIDYIKDQSQIQESITNLEQIMHLQWIGKYGHDHLKIGKWTAIWQGESLIDIGGFYSIDGKKQGQWNQLIKNYNQHAKVYEFGEYYKNLRIGIWKQYYKGDFISQGQYDQDGEKIGKWIELSKHFSDHSQIIFKGEYKHGEKIGLWEIYLKSFMDNDKSYKQMQKYFRQLYFRGYGLYQYKKGSDFTVKNGKWIELNDEYCCEYQVIHKGRYNDGIKIGSWDILVKTFEQKSFRKIGGGSYQEIKEQNNEFLQGVKIGKWIEVINGFRSERQVIFSGEYNNGLKVGRWDTFWKDNDRSSYKQIGGGSYDYEKKDDDVIYSVKVGCWVELSDNFCKNYQVIFKGGYKNGKKVGRWDTRYRWRNIGGGSYGINQFIEGNQQKTGQWIELGDNFNNDCQTIYKGEYKNGKKVGKWDILYRNHPFNSFLQIGGGSYHQDVRFCFGIKQGKWIELINGFCQQRQILCEGEYHFGKKVGRWNYLFKFHENEPFEQIGGGLYEQKYIDQNEINCLSIKQGLWIELFDDFCCPSQIIYQGEYHQGIKVGRWDIFYLRCQNKIEQMQQLQLSVLKYQLFFCKVVEDYMRQTTIIIVLLELVQDINQENGENCQIGNTKLFMKENIYTVKRLENGIFIQGRIRMNNQNQLVVDNMIQNKHVLGIYQQRLDIGLMYSMNSKIWFQIVENTKMVKNLVDGIKCLKKIIFHLNLIKNIVARVNFKFEINNEFKYLFQIIIFYVINQIIEINQNIILSQIITYKLILHSQLLIQKLQDRYCQFQFHQVFNQLYTNILCNDSFYHQSNWQKQSNTRIKQMVDFSIEWVAQIYYLNMMKLVRIYTYKEQFIFLGVIPKFDKNKYNITIILQIMIHFFKFFKLTNTILKYIEIQELNYKQNHILTIASSNDQILFEYSQKCIGDEIQKIKLYLRVDY